MVEDNKNTNGVVSLNDKNNDNEEKSLIEAVAELAKDNEGLHVLSHQIARTSSPVDENASVAQQISFAEEKLKRHYALKKSVKTKADNANQSRHLIDLDIIKNVLKESTLGAGLLKGHGLNKVELVLDEQIFDVKLHKQSKKIGIHPQMTYGEAIFYTARELRRAWLSLEGTLLYPLAYLPDDAILMNRILEADARAVAVWTAWELKLQGFDDAWDYILSSNEEQMAGAFARSAKADFRNLDNGVAARAAFDAWFFSGMVKKIDHRIIQDMLADEKGYVFSSEEPPLTITASLVDAIGEVPGQRNYLMGTGEKPLPGSDFAAVKDRSNANFLWFVKFEKSFQATEAAITQKEREEEQRLENIEKSRNAAIDIKEIASKDEKIVDFSGRFEQQLEMSTSDVSKKKKDKSQALDQKKKATAQDTAEIVYLFGGQE